MALSVTAVSIRVSPFCTEDVAHRHVHHVGAEPLAGKLERALGPGRGFEEEIDQGAAAQIVALLGDLPAEFGGFVRKIEQRRDLVSRKAFDSKKMAMRKGNIRGSAAMLIKGHCIGRAARSGKRAAQLR